MNQHQHSHGGARPGAGRPKKKARDLQKTHSIRATDKDWKEIQLAARTIKTCSSIDRRPRIFMLTDDEQDKVNQFFLNGLIEAWQNARWGEPDTTPPPQPPLLQEQKEIEITKPRNFSEEEAVSIFLEYYRTNPIESVSLVQSKLEQEQRIREARERRQRQSATMDKFDERMQNAMDSIDDINERIAKMLQFPGAGTK